MPSWNGHFRAATDPKFGVRIFMPTSTCAPAPRVESIKHSKCLMLGVRTLPSLQLIGHEVARTESQRLLLSAQSQGVSPQEQSRGGRRGSAARRRSRSRPRSRRAGLRGPGAATETRAAPPGRVRRERERSETAPAAGGGLHRLHRHAAEDELDLHHRVPRPDVGRAQQRRQQEPARHGGPLQPRHTWGESAAGESRTG